MEWPQPLLKQLFKRRYLLAFSGIYSQQPVVRHIPQVGCKDQSLSYPRRDYQFPFAFSSSYLLSGYPVSIYMRNTSRRNDFSSASITLHHLEECDPLPVEGHKEYTAELTMIFRLLDTFATSEMGSIVYHLVLNSYRLYERSPAARSDKASFVLISFLSTFPLWSTYAAVNRIKRARGHLSPCLPALVPEDRQDIWGQTCVMHIEQVAWTVLENGHVRRSELRLRQVIYLSLLWIQSIQLFFGEKMKVSDVTQAKCDSILVWGKGGWNYSIYYHRIMQLLAFIMSSFRATRWYPSAHGSLSMFSTSSFEQQALLLFMIRRRSLLACLYH